MTTAQTAPTRSVKGLDFPAPGSWKLDEGHANVGFVGRHFMLTKIRGRFRAVDATIHIGTDPTDTRVSATINTASVDSGDAARDDHLRSPDHFDIEQFPTATFESTRVEWDGGQHATLIGDLTIKGITQEVRLDVEYRGYARDPRGNDRAVFAAHGSIDRTDFGLSWNAVLESGGLLVSKQIELVLEAEFVRSTDT